MQTIIRFFLSIKTAFGFFFIFAVLAFIGSLSLPNNLAFFSGIDDTPLFKWLNEAGAWGTTWWIYALIATLALFAVNTIFCTVEALLKRMSAKGLIVKLSPQIMHIGVLFIMLGHLLTASLGVKVDISLKKGETRAMGENTAVTLEDVKVWEDANGYAVDWLAELRWTEKGRKTGVLGLRPARPLYPGSYGIYSKSVTADKKGPSALIRVCRDPGALWALAGGLLLSIGGLGFLYGRFSAESSSFQR